MGRSNNTLWAFFFVLALLMGWALLDTFFGGVQPTPRTLPPAYLNEPYDVEIDISNILIDGSFKSEISSDKFTFIPEQRTNGNNIYGQLNIIYDYGKVHLVGTPTDLTPVQITIKGAIYGTMFSGSRSFTKKYTLEIKQR